MNIETEENMIIKYIDSKKSNVKIKLSLLNNVKIHFKLQYQNKEYIKQFESYDFNSFEFFDDLSPKKIYNYIKETLSPKNIEINQENINNDSALKINISIMTEFDKENFVFFVSKNVNKPMIKVTEKEKEENNINNNIKNEVIIEKENHPEKYIATNNICQQINENKISINKSNNTDIIDFNNNYYDDPDEEYIYYIEDKNKRSKEINNLQKNINEKEKIELIKNNYLHRKVFCHLCQEYTYINKLYKKSDDINCEILVKYYCSESHEDHCCSLIDFLFICCKREIITEDTTKSFRNGKKMELSNDELNSIKKEYNNMKEKIPNKNKNLKEKILQEIPDVSKLTSLQKTLCETFDKSFNQNSFINEILFYFIKMCINTYEDTFNKYPSQAITCTLRNFTDYTDSCDNDNKILELKNDITKDLLNGINYFKKNFIVKIYEPEIDINKIKNKANITITNDEILCLKYLDEFKVLLMGSVYGKIYFVNLEKNKCYCQIQAHREDEEKRGYWGIWYINEIYGNRLITCCEDSTMKLWEIIVKSDGQKSVKVDIKYLTVLRGHRDMVRKVIQLKNNKRANNNIKLVSCSFDCCLGFWEEKSKNKFELIKIMQSHNYFINEIYEIYDGRIFAIGGEYDPFLKIWDPNNYTFELVKDKMYCVNHDCIIEINSDYYIIGGNHSYLIMFRLSGKMIVRVICIDNMYINSLILLSDGNILADSGKNAIKYVYLGNFKVQDAIQTQSSNKINWTIVRLSNKRFISSDRQCIKIWEY